MGEYNFESFDNVKDYIKKRLKIGTQKEKKRFNYLEDIIENNVRCLSFQKRRREIVLSLDAKTPFFFPKDIQEYLENKTSLRWTISTVRGLKNDHAKTIKAKKNGHWGK